MLNSSPNVFLGSLQIENIIISKVYGTDANVMKLEGCVASKPTVVISPNQDTTPSFLFFFVSLHSFDIIETKARGLLLSFEGKNLTHHVLEC